MQDSQRQRDINYELELPEQCLAIDVVGSLNLATPRYCCMFCRESPSVILGAFIIRLGFGGGGGGVLYYIVIIRNAHNSMGNDLGP